MGEEEKTLEEERKEQGQRQFKNNNFHNHHHKHHYYHHSNKNSENTESKKQDEPSKASEVSEEKTEPKQEAETFVSVAEFVKLKYQLAEMINRYKQQEHEFDNYRIRTKQEAKQTKVDGVIKAVETILPALDSFKKAKALITDKSSLSGVSLIEKNLLNSLEKLNIRYIDCIGKEFDPELHNAVMLVEDSTKKPNTIVDELEMGFTLDDKVIKYSQVIVSK